MGRSNIPPRTMRDVALQLLGLGVGVRLTTRVRRRHQTGSATSGSDDHPTGLFRKPRNWRFQTKPLFKKVHGPLVDVFDEAEEVLIVIDLAGFLPGNISMKLTQEKYVIVALRGDEEFREEILLPPEVDLEKCVEKFRNGVLEITLPRRDGAKPPEGE